MAGYGAKGGGPVQARSTPYGSGINPYLGQGMPPQGELSGTAAAIVAMGGSVEAALGATGAPMGAPMNTNFGQPMPTGFPGATGMPLPHVNPSHVNPAKPLMEGGVGFKSILQEKIAKDLRKTLSAYDLVYNVTGYKGTKSCVLQVPCMGPDKSYVSDPIGIDDKQAHQMAAAKAMEDLFPDLYQACLAAHTGQGPGGSQQVDPFGEPKGCLNQRVQLVSSNPLQKTDITYECAWNYSIKGYSCKLTIHPLGQTWEGHAPNCNDQRVAEKNAAREALVHNKDRFEEAVKSHEVTKARKDAKNDKYRPGAGKGKSFKGGKDKGKGKFKY